MANADKPAAAGPPPETAVTSTPPPPAAAPGEVAPTERRARRPLTPERLAQDIRRLDRFLAALVLPLAFLLASFAIHNSDFWMHLATGRALVQGSYDVFAGNDPFSSTTAGTHWINHAWLFDWAVYGLYLLAGGPGLVVLKGVLIVALAVVLFQIRRPGQSLWAPVVCVGLALLAMSPRLLFQPMVLSLLFLGITLVLLMRADDEPGRPSSRRLWLLVPLFALWANLDNWFLLGPLTVALFLLGDWLQQHAFPKDGWDGKRVKARALVLAVSLAACLLNPSGLRVFALPPELAYLVVYNPEAPPSEWTAGGTTLRALTSVDPTFYHVFSPLSKNYYSRPEIGLNVAGLTYFVLLGLGLLSFLLVGLAGRTAAAMRLGPRLLIWLVFAGLSLLMARLIPFFAVVAGPVTALNLQDFAWQRFGSQVRTQGPWGLWSLGGRLLTGLGCLGLLFLAWPGWLHGQPDESRASHRVAWRLYEDPSLRQATERLRELQHSGRLNNGFNSLPDVASYMAWFCPAAKSFFDQRLDLDAGSVADYVRARKSLSEEAKYIIRVQSDPRTPAPGHDWQEVFRSRGVNYLVLPMEGNVIAGVLAAKFLLDPLHWAPLYVDGRTMIFGWQPPEQPHAFRDVALDLGREAFGPVAEDRRAPRQAPEWPQEPRDFWQHYWWGPPERPLAASEGRFYLIDYNMRSQQWLGLVSQSWRFDQWLGPVGTASVIPGSLSGPATLATFIPRQLMLQRSQNNRPVLVGADNGPPADPVLAVRAGRRAVAASPEDTASYLLLADAYHILWENQEQRWVSRPARGPQAFLDLLRGGGNLLDRQTLRQIQFTTARSEFARLQAEQASAQAADIHWELARIYLGLNYKDLGLEQMREAVAHLPASPPSAAPKDQLNQKREAFERILKNVEADVKKRQEYFKLQTTGGKLHPLQGFEIALLKPYQATDENNRKTVDRRGLGLARQALDLLRQANLSALTDMEKQILLDWQLRLLLTIGRVAEVREILTPGLKPLLRARYDEFEAVLGAATGDYQRADQALAELEKQSAAFEKLFLNQQRSFLVLTLAFDPPVQMLPIVRASEFALQQMMARNVVVNPVGQAEAGLRTLRGLLALEQGDTSAAAAHFRAALRRARAGMFFPDRAIVERYLRLLKAP